jgi:hypothetical protein
MTVRREVGIGGQEASPAGRNDLTHRIDCDRGLFNLYFIL